MNIKAVSNAMMMKAAGFKKVLLNDSKKVLNETNNYKWEKATTNKFNQVKKTTTFLPSGTMVATEKSINPNIDYFKKTIVKSDGTTFSIKTNSDGDMIMKNGQAIKYNSRRDFS